MTKFFLAACCRRRHGKKGLWFCASSPCHDPPAQGRPKAPGADNMLRMPDRFSESPRGMLPPACRRPPSSYDLCCLFRCLVRRPHTLLPIRSALIAIEMGHFPLRARVFRRGGGENDLLATAAPSSKAAVPGRGRECGGGGGRRVKCMRLT